MGQYQKNLLTWPRDIIQFGKDAQGNVSSINPQSAFRTYGGSKISKLDQLIEGVNTFLNEDQSEKLKSTSFMFDGAALFDGDLSGLEMGTVTEMYAMFRNTGRFNNGATNARRDGDKNYDGSGINNWETGNVGTGNVGSDAYIRQMRQVFWNALSFNQPVDGWDISNVQDINTTDGGWIGGMARMFGNTPKFDQDLSDWKNPNFYKNLQTSFNTSLSGRVKKEAQPSFTTNSPYEDDAYVIKTRDMRNRRWKDYWNNGNKDEGFKLLLPFQSLESDGNYGLTVHDNNGTENTPITHTVNAASGNIELVLPRSGNCWYTIQATEVKWDNSDKSGNVEKANNLKWPNDVIQFGDTDLDGDGDIANGMAAFFG